MTKIERLKFLAAVLIASFLGHWLKFDEGVSRYDHKPKRGRKRGRTTEQRTVTMPTTELEFAEKVLKANRKGSRPPTNLSSYIAMCMGKYRKHLIAKAKETK